MLSLSSEKMAEIIVVAVGASLGSFLNVVLYRHAVPVAAGRRPATIVGRSRCPACGRQLTAFELIPVISYLVQRGRCRTCRQPISPQYPLVELGTAVLFAAILTPLPATLSQAAAAAFDLLFALVLIILFVVDLKTFLLPDKFVVVLSLAAFGRLLTSHDQLPVHFWGALIGSGFLACLWIITRGRGLGLGDVKLMLPLGLRFGVAGTVTLLFLAFVAGGLLGFALLATHRAHLKTAVPFGPLLTGAALSLLIWPSLPHWFLQFLGWPL